ncbi:MAG: hypothetical protein JWN69_1701 [Alphaproteobacteria bacterium]|nr:hypothetical protein [Alphaproteobacteria bacterium]
MATRTLTADRRDRLFYTAMGAVIAATTFAGFARTYYLSHWIEAPARMPRMTLLLHIHAVAFTLWILIGAIQPALVAVRKVALHRSLGWFGAATAASVWLLGNLAAIDAIEHGYRGLGDPFAFYSITFFSMQMFGPIVLLAILLRRDAETHKRLMLLSSAAILEAAVGRLPFAMVAATAPVSFYLGPDLIIVAGIIHDRLTRGTVHKVWIWGGGALVASQLLRVAIMHSPAWLAFAHMVADIW